MNFLEKLNGKKTKIGASILAMLMLLHTGHVNLPGNIDLIANVSGWSITAFGLAHELQKTIIKIIDKIKNQLHYY